MVTDVTRLPIRFDGDRVAAFCRARALAAYSASSSTRKQSQSNAAAG